MIEQKDVTIIVPYFGRSEEERRAWVECLVSLKQTCSCPIVFVANGVEQHFEFNTVYKPEGLQVIAMERQGQCGAVNAAVATTNTPWIMVTNDDMVYAPGWFERLTSNIECDGHLCVSPKLIEPQDGAPTFEKFFAGGAGGDFDKEKWLEFARQYELRSEEEKKIRPGFNLPFLISRDLWNTVGGYDINFDPWGSNSDSDLEYKIKLAGVQPVQNPRAIVYHFSQTSGTFEPRNRDYWQKNWEYFKEKWGFYRTDDGIWQATFEIPSVLDGRTYEPWWEGMYKTDVPMVQAISSEE